MYKLLVIVTTLSFSLSLSGTSCMVLYICWHVLQQMLVKFLEIFFL